MTITGTPLLAPAFPFSMFDPVHLGIDGEKDPWGRDLDETTVLIIKTWHYAGTGYIGSPGAQQATAAAARARDHEDQTDDAA
jgi:hypothetical protein